MKKFTIGCFSIVLIASCADRTLVEESESLRMISFMYPPTVILGFAELYELRVTLEGYLREDDVYCTLTGQGIDYYFQLSDMGAILFSDSTDIVPGETGDNVPGDGIYTRLVELGGLPEGDYTLLAEAMRGDETQSEESGTFVVSVDTPPTVEAIEYPDSLHSGFDSEALVFRILDPDPNDDITLVELVDVDIPIAPLTMSLLNDTLAFIELDNTFGAGRIGWRDMVVRAFDTPGLMGTDSFQIWVGNNSPSLGDLTFFELPDCDTSMSAEELELVGDTLVIFLPSEGARCFHMSIPVEEEQGWLDLDYVLCWVWSTDSLRYIGSLGFNDEGNAVDDLAGDGIFTSGFSFFPPPVNNPDTYLFEIHATDNVGQHSDTLVAPVVVLAPTPGSIGVTPMTRDHPFNSRFTLYPVIGK